MYLTENPTNSRKTSTLELEWLAFMAHSRQCSIRTAFNNEQGQQMAGRFALDGYDAEHKVAFEFLGCLCHGHLSSGEACSLSVGLTKNSKTPWGRLIHEVFTQWLRKKIALESGETPLGKVTVVYIWECLYLRQKEEDPNLQEFLQHYYKRRPLERLTLRRALRGGRTECKFLEKLTCLRLRRPFHHPEAVPHYPFSNFYFFLCLN